MSITRSPASGRLLAALSGTMRFLFSPDGSRQDGQRHRRVGAMPTPRWPMLRWSISSATLVVPQAGGPIAFALVALSLTGDTRGGAAMILAMTLAQVAGAMPITRLGRSLPLAAFFKLLVAVRTL